MQNKAQVFFFLCPSQTSIIIDFHCIFSFLEYIFQAKLLLLLLLMVPKGFRESFFAQNAACRPRQRRKGSCLGE